MILFAAKLTRCTKPNSLKICWFLCSFATPQSSLWFIFWTTLRSCQTFFFPSWFCNLKNTAVGHCSKCTLCDFSVRASVLHLSYAVCWGWCGHPLCSHFLLETLWELSCRQYRIMMSVCTIMNSYPISWRTVTTGSPRRLGMWLHVCMLMRSNL